MNNLRTTSRIGGSSGGTLLPPNIPTPAALHQALDCVLLVIGSKMGISHRHLDRPVAHELSDRAQINSGHDKSSPTSAAWGVYKLFWLYGSICG
jgi:hypothetical protein